MPRCQCCVRDCRQQGGHRFPQDPALRAEWVDALSKPRTWQPSRKSVVCFKHFLEEDYTEFSVSGEPLPMMRLRPGAVPSRFDLSSPEDEARISRLAARRETLRQGRELQQQQQQELQLSPPQPRFVKRQSQEAAASKLRTRVPVPRRFDEVEWPGSAIKSRAHPPKELPQIEVDRDESAAIDSCGSQSKLASAATSSVSSHKKMATGQPVLAKLAAGQPVPVSKLGPMLSSKQQQQAPLFTMQGSNGPILLMASSSASSSLLQSLRTSGSISLLSGSGAGVGPGTTLRLTPASSVAVASSSSGSKSSSSGPGLPRTLTLVKQVPGAAVSKGGKAVTQLVSQPGAQPGAPHIIKLSDRISRTVAKGFPTTVTVVNGSSASSGGGAGGSGKLPQTFKLPLPVLTSHGSAATTTPRSTPAPRSAPTLKLNSVVSGSQVTVPTVRPAQTVLTTQPMKSLLTNTKTTGSAPLRSLIPKTGPATSTSVVVSTPQTHISAASDAIEAVRILESLSSPGSETMLVPVKSKSIGTSVSEEDPSLEHEEVDFGPSVPTTMQNPWTTATYHKLLTPISLGSTSSSVVSSAGKELIVVRPEKAVVSLTSSSSPRKDVLMSPSSQDNFLLQLGKSSSIRVSEPSALSSASTTRVTFAASTLSQPRKSNAPVEVIVSPPPGFFPSLMTSKVQASSLPLQQVKISPAPSPQVLSSSTPTLVSASAAGAASTAAASTSAATSVPIINPHQSARSKSLQALQLSKNAARQASLKARAEKKKNLEELPVFQKSLAFPVMQMMPEGNVYLVNPNLDQSASSDQPSSDDDVDKDSDHSERSSERETGSSPAKVVFPFNKSHSKKGKKLRSARPKTPPAPQPEEQKDLGSNRNSGHSSDVSDFDLSRVKMEPVEEEEAVACVERLEKEVDKQNEERRRQEEEEEKVEEEEEQEEEVEEKQDREAEKQEEETKAQKEGSQKPEEEEEEAFPFLKITSVFSLSNEDASNLEIKEEIKPKQEKLPKEAETKAQAEDDPDPLEDRIMTFHPCNVVLERLEKEEEEKPEEFARHRAKCSKHCRERHVKYLCDLKLIPCQTFTHDPKPGKPSRFRGKKFLSTKAQALRLYNQCIQRIQEQKRAAAARAADVGGEREHNSLRNILQMPLAPVAPDAVAAGPSTSRVMQVVSKQSGVVPMVPGALSRKAKIGAPITLKLPSTALAAGLPVGEPGKRPTFLLYKIGGKQILAPLNDPTFAKILQSAIKTPKAGTSTGTSTSTPSATSTSSSGSTSTVQAAGRNTGAPPQPSIPTLVGAFSFSTTATAATSTTAAAGSRAAAAAGKKLTVWKPLDSNIKATPMPASAAAALTTQHLMKQQGPSSSTPLSYTFVPTTPAASVTAASASTSSSSSSSAPAATSSPAASSSGTAAQSSSQSFSLPPGIRIKPEPKTKGYGDEEPEPEPEPPQQPKPTSSSSSSSSSGKKSAQKRDAPPELVPQVRVKRERLDPGYGDVDETPAPAAPAAEAEPPQLMAERRISTLAASPRSTASASRSTPSSHSSSTVSSAAPSSATSSSPSSTSSAAPSSSRPSASAVQQSRAPSSSDHSSRAEPSTPSTSGTRFSTWGKKRPAPEPSASTASTSQETAASSSDSSSSCTPPPAKLQRPAFSCFHNERISKLKEKMRQQELFLEQLQRQREQQALQGALAASSNDD